MYKIAISGKANSGKNTLSELLASKICGKMLKSKNIAFADPIKEIIKNMYPQIKRKHLFGPSKFRNEIIPGSFKDGNPLTIRMLLQDIGESFKKYNSKIWIEAFDKKFSKCSTYHMVIASDLRFIDEFKYLKENNFNTIRLIRDGISTMSHISETQQDQIKNNEFDHIIVNNGTLEDLEKSVSKIIPLLKS